MWMGLFLVTLEISVFLEFVQMVFHTIRSQIKDRSQSLAGTVLWQTLKAAKTNPATELKKE